MMRKKDYKLENTLGKLIKELRNNKYSINSYTESYPCLTFEISKDCKENPYRCNPLGRIYVADEPNGVETKILIYGGEDFLKDKEKILSIAKKYLEKQPKIKSKSTKHKFEGYKHHQWINEGYRAARSSPPHSTNLKPKYNGNLEEVIEKRKIPPQ